MNTKNKMYVETGQLWSPAWPEKAEMALTEKMPYEVRGYSPGEKGKIDKRRNRRENKFIL